MNTRKKLKCKPLQLVGQVSLFLLLMPIILSSSASGQETYRFERTWPTLPQPWYFNSPQGIAVGPDGPVYVIDYGYARIQKFTQDGLFITAWGRDGLGDGEFGRCDYGSSCYPTNGIAFDTAGNVYVTDTVNHRIQKFSPHGTFVSKWGRNGGDGSYGAGDGEFNYPSGIALDSGGSFYVTDYYNHRVQKFGPDGSFVTKWGRNEGDGSYGTGDGEFFSPSSVTVGPDDLIYVTDEYNHRIQKFTADGTFLLKWDNTHPSGARYFYPRDLTSDEEGNIYVTNRRRESFLPNIIHKINQYGQVLESWESVFFASGIAVDPGGRLYVTDINNHRIVKLNPGGEVLQIWAGYQEGYDQPLCPEYIAVSNEGHVYVTKNQYEIQIYDLDGTYVGYWGGLGSGDGEFGTIRGITVDDQGDVFVCDKYSNRIQRFTPAGQYVAEWGTAGNAGYEPAGIAIDSRRHIYVTGFYVDVLWNYRCRVQKYIPNPDGISYDPDIMWDTWGENRDQAFTLVSGITVARDELGDEYVYVADGPGYIHKFAQDGSYETTWSVADRPGAIPRSVVSDVAGHIYVADNLNGRVLKFTSEGFLITSFGGMGSGFGQLSTYHHLAVDSNEKVYVADTYNNRIQVFTKVESIENSRAIIVAGGGSEGNNLWDATQVCASFAYRALTYQGFTKDDIIYLSEDTDLDLDDDGESNVAAVPAIPRLNTDIMQAGIDNVENLVVYLTDHGGTDESGEGTFRLSESETLAASDLASMLAGFPGRVIVIIDACQSGSFITALEGTNRIIITSTQPDEQAKFINQGTISFSNFFWTGVFNGSSLWDSYHTASLAINVLGGQTPDIRPPNVSTGIRIGNGVSGMVGDAPDIGGITITPPELHLETQAVLRANNVIDPDGIARVWAVIWPPNFDPGSVANPLTDLPSVDLLPVEGEEGNYEVAYNGFTAMGIYQIAIYAMDRKGNASGNASNPGITSISRNLARRAVIVAGGADGELSRAIINQNASLAYNALISQQYKDNEINLISPLIITPTVFYLGAYLEYLASDSDIEDNLDLTIYLIGAGDTQTFVMNDDVNMNDDNKILTASQLYGWFDEIQLNKQARLTLIYDGNKSGSFIQGLMPPEGTERIIITSTGPESAAYFKTEGSVSFSSFFWDRIAAGATIGDAFIYAKSAISYCTRENDISFSCYRPQQPLMDANSNGIANELNDYEITEALYLGDGVAYADDPPLIGSVSVAREGDWITIAAHNVSSVNPVEKVWAVIRPIGYCPGDSAGVPLEVREQELFDPDGDNTYAYTLDVPYACKVTVYAMSRAAAAEEPDISEPSTPIINQPGGDIYEDPDGNGIPDGYSSEANVIVVNHSSPQPHTFHHENDADWVKFYGVAWENEVNEQVHTYTIEAGNLGVNCPVIELYKEGDLIEPLPIPSEPPANNKVWIDFDCTRHGLYQEGTYYVNVSWGGCDYKDGEMGYDLRVYDAVQELTGQVEGKVEDSVSGADIDGVIITSNGVGVAISTRGGQYLMSEMLGSWTMTARKDGYVDASYGFRIDTNDQRIRQDIDMQPRETGGCRTAADCDDGRFCNGTETCANRTCQPGMPPCADDGIFCNGIESCNEENDSCGHSGNPCSEGLTCDEERDVCSNCIENAQCDNGLFCDGIETCVDGDCQLGTSPCPEGVECDEEADTCLMPGISIFPRTIMQSRWIPLPLFMSIRGINTHFSGVSKVTFSPPSIMNVPFVINEQTLFCMGLIMPTWITGELGDSIEVTVKTNLENATGSIEVNLMPFMLGEERGQIADFGMRIAE